MEYRKYQVEITEILQKVVDVTTSDLETAIKVTEKEYYDGNIVLDHSDFVEVTIDEFPADGGSPETDNVNHPAHYTSGKVETIDFIQDKLPPEMFEGYCVGNVMKYITRYQRKNGVEDLKKAAWYLDRIIKELEKEAK